MGMEELDAVITEVLRTSAQPLSVGEIDRAIATRGLPADTYDVQRSVRRLVDSGKAKVTPRYQVLFAG